MGARANIRVKQSTTKPSYVYLYSHWKGESLTIDLKQALARKQRWDDESYLARIIFCQMVKGYEAEETGFGISTEITDNNFPVITVDPSKATVTIEGHKPIPFQDYIAMPDDDLQRLMDR